MRKRHHDLTRIRSLPSQSPDKSGVMGELCRIVRHLGSGIRLGGTTGPANGAATILAQSTAGKRIAAIASSSEGVPRQILKSAHTVLGRDKAVIQVSYESQVMVGRVAADRQNNPAVRGYWTDHHLGATLALALACSD